VSWTQIARLDGRYNRCSQNQGITMKLYGSPTSPYVRKVRVLIAEKKVHCEFVPEDPWPAESPITTRNPLGKVPALEIGPGNYLFDSVLVVHYLDRVDGKSLTPADAAGYWQTQWWQSLGNGIIDAVVARVLESRRPPEKQMPELRSREEARVHRAIAAAEARLIGSRYLGGSQITLADLIMGVALQYTDFRYPHDWRASCPRLAAWHARIASRKSFQSTLPPGFVPPS
jgi:glutathione S-transferase